jgi:hypothetical protein
MSTKTMKRKADALREAEVERWREVWTAFWERVDARAPEYDRVATPFFASLTDAELDTWSSGTVPERFAAESHALAAEWQERLDAEIGPDPDQGAWDEWAERVRVRLPHPLVSDFDPAAWPGTMPPPPPIDPVRHAGERAFFHARLAEAPPTSCAAFEAASALHHLALAEALREVVGRG